MNDSYFKHRLSSVVGICLALLLPAYARAAPGEKDRVLGEHRFPVAEFTPSVFSLTSFGMRVGVELHQVPDYAQLPPWASESSRVNLRSVLAAEAFDLSIKLHEYVAIFGSAYGRARVGADRTSLLNTGIDYAYGGTLGALVKLLRVGKFQLGARAHFGASTGSLVSIGPLFRDLNGIASQAVQDATMNSAEARAVIERLRALFRVAVADLTSPFSTWTLAAAVTAAVGFNPYLGLQGSLGISTDAASYSVSQFNLDTRAIVPYDRDIQTLRPSLTLAFDVDGAPARIPLDVMLEYQLAPIWANTSALGVDVDQSSLQQVVALGLYYSGRPDLQLGISAFLVFGQTPLLGDSGQPSGHPRETSGRFVFRYFW